VSALRCGPAGGLPAGYARCEAGTVLMRGHSPSKAPDWFGPAVTRADVRRFDVPLRTADDPGVCYLAPSLEGVLLERVIRDSTVNPLSHATMSREHAITAARLTRDLVLIDLLAAHECIALWDRAAAALAWGETVSLGADRNALALACTRLGIGLRE